MKERRKGMLRGEGGSNLMREKKYLKQGRRAGQGRATRQGCRIERELHQIVKGNVNVVMG